MAAAQVAWGGRVSECCITRCNTPQKQAHFLRWEMLHQCCIEDCKSSKCCKMSLTWIQRNVASGLRNVVDLSTIIRSYYSTWWVFLLLYNFIDLCFFLWLAICFLFGLIWTGSYNLRCSIWFPPVVRHGLYQIRYHSIWVQWGVLITFMLLDFAR